MRGKIEKLASLAKSSLSEDELEFIANNPELISNQISELRKFKFDFDEGVPNEEVGKKGEEFVYQYLVKLFGKERVKWNDCPEFDFTVLENDLINIKFYIDAKTVMKGLANSENVPFYMRMAQWKFLDKPEVKNKYLIARVFMSDSKKECKFLMIDSFKLVKE